MNTVTVEKLREALKEAKKENAYVYVVETGGYPDIWVNDASYNNVAQGVYVIQLLTTDILDDGYFMRVKDNVQEYLTLEEFVAELDAKYN